MISLPSHFPLLESLGLKLMGLWTSESLLSACPAMLFRWLFFATQAWVQYTSAVPVSVMLTDAQFPTIFPGPECRYQSLVRITSTRLNSFMSLNLSCLFVNSL